MARIEPFFDRCSWSVPGLLVHFDIADFKRFNIHMGYTAGDQVIAEAHEGIRR